MVAVRYSMVKMVGYFIPVLVVRIHKMYDRMAPDPDSHYGSVEFYIHDHVVFS
jgi:hypothetical protein